MKLLFLIEGMSADVGGPAAEVAWLSKLLAEEGHEVTIATGTGKNESIPTDEKVNYISFDNPQFLHFSWLNAIKYLKKLIVENDIIFATGIWGPIDGFALRLAWQKNKPVFIRVCGMLEPYILSRHPVKKRIGSLMYVKKNLERAAGVIVNSLSEAEHVEKAGVKKEKILVIPNGIKIPEKIIDKKTAKKELGLDPEEPVLLYLGRIHPKKGLHFLLEALSGLNVPDKHFKLVVAGDFSDSYYQNKIEHMVQVLQNGKKVVFTGFSTGAKKILHFCAADCFILPSESEGLPNAVLEAMAYKLPVIITHGCNIPEVEQYNAGLVVDTSSVKLKDAINWFLTGKDNLLPASENAFRLASEKFSESTSLKLYVSLIKKYELKTQNNSN